MSIIQFENGTKVNFDGDPSPSDVEEVAKSVGVTAQSKTPTTGQIEGGSHTDDTSGAWFPASPDDTALEAGAKTFGNLIPSAINTGVGMVKGVAGIPSQISSTLSEAAATGDMWNDVDKEYHDNLEKVNGIISDYKAQGKDTTKYDKILARMVANPPASRGAEFIKNIPSAALTTVESILPFLKPALKGDLSGTAQEIENNPVGNILPIVAATDSSVRGLADRGVLPKSAPRTLDTAISKTAQTVTKPAGAVMDWAKNKVGEAAAYGASQATGFEPSTVKTVKNNTGAFTPENMAKTDRLTLAQEINSRLQSKISDLSEAGQAYGPIRASTAPVRVFPEGLSDLIMKETGLTIEQAKPTPSEAGVIQMEPGPSGIGKLKSGPNAIIRDQGDVNRLQAIYNRYQPLFENGQMTPNEYLNLRQDLDKVANYETKNGKSAPLEASAQRMRGQLNDQYRNQIPGLKETDIEFGGQKSELDNLSQRILDRDGNLQESAINTIANATGKGKDLLLNRLEQIVPGITKKIQILKAVEDIQNSKGPKVGTYARSGAIPMAAYSLFSGNIPVFVTALTTAILTSPGAAVPILRAYGASAEVTAAVLKNLRQYLNPDMTKTRTIPFLPKQSAPNLVK